MNILLSAYACEPNKGSEPGVGWSWAIEISKYHKVWVLTKDNNKGTIEEYLNMNPQYKNENLNFVYVGLPKKLTFWKKGRRGMRLFMVLWQKKALKVAKKLNKEVKFDIVHHVTFVSYTQPTYMYKLGIPLIWGPIAGGENIPKVVNVTMSKKEQILELIRRLSQGIVFYLPSIRNTAKNSKYILAATEETKNKFPQKYHNKIMIMPAIGLDYLHEDEMIKIKNKTVKIIMAGRLIYLKAFELGIDAFIQLLKKYDNIQLHILGEGPLKEELMNRCGEYLNNKIIFESPVVHDQIYDFYKQFDIYLSTTLRDSGCMTMLEAMSVGLPCVCIATGGPKILSDSMPYCQVQPQENQSLINEIEKRIEEIIVSDDVWRKYILDTKKTCERFTTESKFKAIDRLYKKIV